MDDEEYRDMLETVYRNCAMGSPPPPGSCSRRAAPWWTPTPSVIAGRTWTNDPYGGANYLGLSVEIPILDTRRGPLAKAEADAITATLRRELAQAEVGANLERLANVIAARQSALQRFDQEAAVRLPALDQA